MSNKTLESPVIQHVLVALHAVHDELAKVGMQKDGENNFDKYRYRTIDGLYNLIAPILAKHRLLVIPHVLSCDQTTRTTAKGGDAMHTLLRVRFTFMSAVDGSTHVTETVGEAMDRGDKSVNKALTAAFKYLMFTAFTLPIVGSDNDADSESHEITGREGDSSDKRGSAKPPYPDAQFGQHFPNWRTSILKLDSAEAKRQRAQNLIATISTKYALSAEQANAILALAEEAE